MFQTELDSAESCERGHGREEIRHLDAVRLLPGYIEWPGAAQICRITRQRVVKGKPSIEVVDAITSLPRERADAADLLALSRGHWLIQIPHTECR